MDIVNPGNGFVGSAITVSISAPVTDNYYSITTSTSPPTGLTTATTYYAIRVDKDLLKVATSISNAYAGTAQG